MTNKPTDDKLEQMLRRQFMLVLSYYDVEWNGLPEEFMDAAKRAIQDWALEQRIDEVREALSYTTMDELKNRYFHLVNMTGGTPFKRKFMSKAELRKQIRGSDE